MTTESITTAHGDIGLTSRRYPLRSTELNDEDGHLWNWARNFKVGLCQQIRRPQTEEQLRNIIAAHPGRIRTVGSRLSSGQLLCGSEPDDLLIDLTAMTGVLDIGEDTITVAGGTLIEVIVATLTRRGRMLACSPGVIAIQTIAGAISTGTHGQGLGQASIADEVMAIRLVLADGSVRVISRADPEFPALQVGLGAFGVITAVTLRTVPLQIFTCRKDAVSAEQLESDLLLWNESFAFSKAWWFIDDNVVHVWNAHQAAPEQENRYWRGGAQLIEHDAGDTRLNDTIDSTLQQMRRDTQLARLRADTGDQFRTVTRFKDFTDVTGDINQVFCRGIAVPQINVEIAIPLERAAIAIRRFRDWYRTNKSHMHYPVILRCTGASSAWLSPAFGQRTLFFGFVVYYADDGTLSPGGLEFIDEAERFLATEGGRPHWGKYFDPGLYDWESIYPKWSQFRALRAQFDPEGKFSNDHIGGLFGN
jgi:FAD/FMN-containing dehydrogenase